MQIKPYRNPIYLAREWRKVLGEGQYSSPVALARHLNISRARVTQILNLLRLSPKVMDIVTLLRDPIKSWIITEKRLRPILALTAEPQKAEVEIMLSKG